MDAKNSLCTLNIQTHQTDKLSNEKTLEKQRIGLSCLDFLAEVFLGLDLAAGVFLGLGLATKVFLMLASQAGNVLSLSDSGSDTIVTHSRIIAWTRRASVAYTFVGLTWEPVLLLSYCLKYITASCLIQIQIKFFYKYSLQTNLLFVLSLSVSSFY